MALIDERHNRQPRRRVTVLVTLSVHPEDEITDQELIEGIKEGTSMTINRMVDEDDPHRVKVTARVQK